MTRFQLETLATDLFEDCIFLKDAEHEAYIVTADLRRRQRLAAAKLEFVEFFFLYTPE